MKTKLEKTALDKTIRQYVSNRRFVGVLLILLMAVVLYQLRGQFIVATVNGRPISRLRVINELENQAGSQVVDKLITQALVTQEASVKNITVSQEEIDKQLSQIESQLKKQGNTLDEALKAQGLTRAEVEEETRFQLLLEKLFADDIKATEKEIEEYMKTNADYFDTLPKEERRQLAEDQVKGEKLQNAFQKWLVSAHDKAKINVWRNY